MCDIFDLDQSEKSGNPTFSWLADSPPGSFLNRKWRKSVSTIYLHSAQSPNHPQQFPPRNSIEKSGYQT